MLKDESIRRRVLERQVDGIKDSITRARNAVMMGNLIAFIALTAMFNSLTSYNYEQLMRRADLIAYVTSLVDESNPPQRPPWLEKSIVKEKSGFSYLAEILQRTGSKKNQSDKEPSDNITQTGAEHSIKNANITERQKQLIELAEFEMKLLVERKSDFDTLELPVIGMSFAASDIGILGGLGVLVVGFWLIGSLKKQDSAIADFILSPSGGNFVITKSYTTEESTYAYKSISNAPVFSLSAKTDWIMGVIEDWIFFFPPIVFGANYLMTIVQAYEGLLGEFRDPRVVAELLIMIALIYIWLKAWRFNRRTGRSVSAWGDCLIEISKESNTSEELEKID